MERGSEESGRHEVVKYVREHLTLVLSALAFVSVFTKLFAVAHGNTVTALAVLNEVGVADVAFGTALANLPTALFIPAFFTTVPLLESIRERDRNLAAVAVPTGLVYLLIVIVAPWKVAVGGLVLLLFFGMSALIMEALRTFANRGGKQRWRLASRTQTWSVNIAFLAFATWLAFLASDVPWLPPERVTVGKTSFVGYVLGSEGDVTIVLRDRDRTVQRLQGVTRRTLCSKRTSRQVSRPLLFAIFNQDEPSYPNC